ncbi:MAG: hypothetical protein KKF67_01600 [Nanoarchaeota archaeon]|nr:hypothetical protein [Nanoarchaeota archaeon]
MEEEHCEAYLKGKTIELANGGLQCKEPCLYGHQKEIRAWEGEKTFICSTKGKVRLSLPHLKERIKGLDNYFTQPQS